MCSIFVVKLSDLLLALLFYRVWSTHSYQYELCFICIAGYLRQLPLLTKMISSWMQRQYTVNSQSSVPAFIEVSYLVTLSIYYFPAAVGFSLVNNSHLV
jgi:hypothetical protein